MWGLLERWLSLHGHVDWSCRNDGCLCTVMLSGGCWNSGCLCMVMLTGVVGMMVVFARSCCLGVVGTVSLHGHVDWSCRNGGCLCTVVLSGGCWNNDRLCTVMLTGVVGMVVVFARSCCLGLTKWWLFLHSHVVWG